MASGTRARRTHARRPQTLARRIPLARGEAQPEVARLDRADDRIAIAGGLDLDPGAADVRLAVGVVRGDLWQTDRGGVVLRPIVTRVGDLDGVDREPVPADDGDPAGRLVQRQI